MPNAENVTKPPFCSYCTSKGVRHKKECKRPLNVYDSKPKTHDVQQQVVEVLKEVFIERIKEVPQPRLEGYELYAKLKQLGYFQGGVGEYMESVSSTDRVYLPHASEIYASFAQNPEGWNVIRDYLARAFIELHETE